MPRDAAVATAMTTDVLSLRGDSTVETALQAMVDRGVDGAPVVDDDGHVVGMLTTSDLIVRESRLHFPTVISILSVTVEVPGRHFGDDVQKALGATVSEVMNTDAITIGVDDTIEQAATSMHDHDVSRLPVVDAEGRLAGIVGRTDILRSILADR
jgi:CBS domain-containing protein